MADEVLIVDDDMINRLVMKKMLGKHQITAHEAENGMDALRMLNDEHSILHVILDLNMPVMDGYTFLQHLNDEEKFGALKIHVMSCINPDVFKSNLNTRSIDPKQIVGFYEKPFKVEGFIENLVNNKEAQS